MTDAHAPTELDRTRFLARTSRADKPISRHFWTGEGYELRPADCLLWTGAANRKGYGRFWDTVGNCWTAKRFAYFAQYGTIPVGCEINQLCRNVSCVEPSHLEAVSTVENLRRRSLFHRLAEKCHQGHLWAETEMFDYRGFRYCGQCKRDKVKRWRAAQPCKPRKLRVRSKKCRHGHDRTAENTYVSPLGKQNCRLCVTAAGARYRGRKLAAQACTQSVDGATP